MVKSLTSTTLMLVSLATAASLADVVHAQMTPPIAQVDSENDGPYLGVGIRDTATTKVTTIYLDSNATRLKIKLGDEITSLNEKKITNLEDLRNALRPLKVGDVVKLEVKRNDKLVVLGPIALK